MGQNLSQGGEASAFSQERFDPTWGGNPPVFFQPVLVGTTRSARNPRTGQILPATYIGLIVPGTGYTCNQVLTAQTPCAINGIVTQRDGNYLDSGDEGFIEPLPIQFDPRVGIAWAVNPRTVIRVAGGSFHDGTGGPTQQQGDGNAAYRLTRTIFYTDFDNYLTGGTGTSPVPNTSGPERTNPKRPNNIRFTAAIQREIGKNVVVDGAYVGSRTKYVSRDFNLNQIPFGRRFDPAYRDPTATPSATQSWSAAGSVPASDPRVRRYQHRPTDWISGLRLGPAAGDPSFHGPLRDGRQLHLGERHGRRSVPEQSAADDRRAARSPGARAGDELPVRDSAREHPVRRQQGRQLDSRQLAHLGHQHVRHGRPRQHRHGQLQPGVRVRRRRRELR